MEERLSGDDETLLETAGRAPYSCSWQEAPPAIPAEQEHAHTFTRRTTPLSHSVIRTDQSSLQQLPGINTQ